MRIHITAAAALSMTLAGPAYAQCTTGQVTEVGLLLSGKLVCAQKIGTNDANNRWSEHHTGTSGEPNNLTEWARGPGDAVDAKRITGSWTANDDTISYTYNGGGGGPYSYTIYDNGDGTYSYCSDASEHSTFKLVSNPAGGNPCNW
jgi:hypothetical protein